MTNPIFSSLRTNTHRAFRITNQVARILAIAMVLLLSFAWWDETQARQDPMLGGEVAGDWIYQWAILTHVLPLLFLIAVVILAWWRPFIGVIGFGLYALLQVVVVAGEWLYLPFVAGPPLVIVIFYLVAYLNARPQPRTESSITS